MSRIAMQSLGEWGGLPLTLVIILAGALAWNFALRSQRDDCSRSLATTFNADMLRAHNERTGASVCELSKLTQDELSAAWSIVRGRSISVAEAAVRRTQQVAAAALFAALCWLAAAARLASMIRHRLIAETSIPSGSREPERSIPMPPNLIESTQPTAIGSAQAGGADTDTVVRVAEPVCV